MYEVNDNFSLMEAVLSKSQMTEEDIKLNYITPAILKGWSGHITMETKITDGRINIRGNMVAHEDKSIQGFFPEDLASSETADLFMSVIMYRLKKKGRAAIVLPDGFLFGTDNAKVNIKKKLLSEFNLHTIIRLPSSVFAPYTSITTNILFFDNTGPTKETWFYRMDMPSDRKHFSKTKPIEVKHFDPVLAWWKNRQEETVDGFDKAKKFTAKELAEDYGYNFDRCGYPHEEEEILAPMELIERYQKERTALNAEIDAVLVEISEKLGEKECV